MKNVAEVILEALVAWGVQNIYGVTGDAVLSLVDALGKQDKIKYFSTATEQGAAFMANGEARVTGKPGVCLATEGPGALNLVNGVADAYRDGIPLLVITGQVDSGKLFTHTKQYFDQQQLFGLITGSTSLLTRPESVMGTLQAAMEKALGDQVPCHLSIPKDIFSSPVEKYHVEPLHQTKPPGINGELGKALQRLERSQRPLLITGRAALPFQGQVVELARRIGAGIIPAQGAKGLISGNSELFLGGLGEAHIPPILLEADLLLLIGASPYEHQYISLNIPLIQLDTRPQNIAHELQPLAVTGDLAEILQELLTGLTGKKPETSWLTKIRQSHEDYLDMICQDAVLMEEPIPPQRVIALLNELLPTDAIIAVDTGEFMHWFDRGFIPQNQQVIISDYWRCMGGGLPLGLGAKVANNAKKVVVVTGDGGFLMTMQEIITAVRYRLPITVIVFNNRGYLLEKHRMEKLQMKPHGVEDVVPDFAALAQSCYAVGMKVEKPEMLPEMLGAALALDNPVVLDIQVSGRKPMFLKG